MPGEQKRTKGQLYREFLKLYDKFPVPTVMRKLGLKQQSQFDRFVSKAFDEGVIMPEKINSLSLTPRPFSYNEDDYGSIPKNTRVTKQGYITYKNNPIKEAKPSKLKRAASLYKQMLIDNNLWKRTELSL